VYPPPKQRAALLAIAAVRALATLSLPGSLRRGFAGGCAGKPVEEPLEEG